MVEQLTEIPARRGKAVQVPQGHVLKLINTHGTQVIDTWAFNAADLHEFMSLEHTRPHIGHIIPKVGDVMFTNKRRPIITLLEDTSPGIHDTIVAACDRYRYKFLGVEGYHDNCTDNLFSGMAELGLTPPEVPSPLNMWMNIPVAPDGSISFQPTVSKAGDFVLLRADMDVVMAFSSCPQDILPINSQKPVECHFQVI
ncbi:MAG TPA: urea carboxylase-associated family protein [Verrucomicrobiae bacterium]|nr:urea carboxylase-associated family protein [Verrucomicrobiae bacterium]